ncbi:MAG TPA: ROK family transcriptional regulator [Nocardioides sp.]|uniref:ROK family transcriptional regulator n=1 Tax=Nocardioides sp. TaxID=35761 RepID=UPI002E2F60E8|nr:ROK family transcriptional regulator [Nocardioides sp.]HEX3929325.1 ROK family transcriptional regulator [Nocardioides sp.]
MRPDDIRQHNLSLLLSHVHRDGALTRAELTQRLSLSRSTVGALVGDLAQLGLVEEVVPNGGARVGRPSHVVAPHACGPYAVGVDVDVAHVTVAAITLGGTITAREVIATDGVVKPDGLVRLVVDAMRRLGSAVASPGRVCGIGVSVPGTVDVSTGLIGVAPNLGWEGVPLGEMLEAELPTQAPVVVGNDADLAVLAEHERGSARDCDDVVFLIGRIGVGAGIIINGVPVRGRDGHAGEIGHNVLDPSGPLCHCGKHGCIETFLGEGALLELAGRRLPRTDSKVAALFADARAGDVAALGAIRAAAETLGRTIANLLNTLNPERVILGGSLGDVLELARPDVEEAVVRYTFGDAGPGVVLETPAFGPDSALVGAGEVAFTALLADPR